MSMVEAKINDLLDRKFTEEDFTNFFLIDIQVLPNNKVQVFLDKDEGITFSDCRRISRYLEEYIDEEGWLGEHYVLEVSSPGLDRPLKLARQYPNQIGRKLEVKIEGGEMKTGVLKSVGAEGIVLEEKVRKKEGKKKTTAIMETSIPFSVIKQTKVIISF